MITKLPLPNDRTAAGAPRWAGTDWSVFRGSDGAIYLTEEEPTGEIVTVLDGKKLAAVLAAHAFGRGPDA